MGEEEKLRARIVELREELALAEDQIREWAEHCMTAGKRIAELEEALRFYATGEWPEIYPGGVHYDPNGIGITTHVDYGEIARAALGEDG